MKTNYLIGIAFVIFLVSGLLVGAISHYSAHLQSTTFKNFISGKDIANYEADFDKKLAHKPVSLNLWNSLGYFLFNEGKEGVLIGQDGWLFTNEEFEKNNSFEDNILKNTDFILKINEQFKKDNVNLVVVLIPSKARLYNKKLGKYKYPSYWQDQYSNLFKALTENKILAVNLLQIFQSQKSQNIFLRTDTHWTPLGARVTAMATSLAITKTYPYLNWKSEAYKSIKKDKITHEGDLMGYTINGGVASKFNLMPDKFYEWDTTPLNNNNQDLFLDKNFAVTLVGTSYSANQMWNFEGFLKEFLSSDILNVSDEGRGPFYVMQNYLESGAYRNSKPKLVIWEIPERYISRESETK